MRKGEGDTAGRSLKQKAGGNGTSALSEEHTFALSFIALSIAAYS